MSAPSRLTPVLLTLTAVTGLVDAVSYLELGKVFTANMTGNVVFLGFALAGTQGLSVARSLLALAAFAAGAAAGGLLARRLASASERRLTATAFGAEAALLAAAAGAAATGTGPAAVNAVIVLTGLAMGLRNATVRKLAVPDLTTTVLTLTITGLAADSPLGGGDGAGWQRRAGAVLAMLSGAALGAWLLRFSMALPLLVCAGLSGAMAALCATRRSAG